MQRGFVDGVGAAVDGGHGRRWGRARASLATLTTVATLVAVALVVALPGRGAAPAATGMRGTVVVSAGTGSDMPGTAIEERPAVSGDGRFVAFTAGGAFGGPAQRSGHVRDVYVRDTVLRTATRLSPRDQTASTGAGADPSGGAPTASPDAESDSYSPSMSADGRYVAFASAAGASRAVVVVCDRGLPHRTSGGFGDRCRYTRLGDGRVDQERPSLSADGTRVAYLEHGHARVADLVRDTSGALVPVAVATSPVPSCSPEATGSCDYAHDSAAVLSSGGRYLATVSQYSWYVGPGEAYDTVLWLLDLSGNAPAQRLDSDGHGSYVGRQVGLDPNIAVSGDGQRVAFTPRLGSVANPPLYLVDRGSGPRVRIVSTTPSGTTSAYAPSLSADGRYLAFVTDGIGVHNGYDYSRLPSGGTCIPHRTGAPGISRMARPRVTGSAAGDYSHCDVVVRDLDRTDPAAELASPRGATCAQRPDLACEGNRDSTLPVLDADGSAVAYVSTASDLVRGDTDNDVDAFEHRFPPALSAEPVAFGAVPYGSAAKRAVTVRYDGFGPLKVDALAVDGADAADFTLDSGQTCGSGLLYPGDSCLVPLRFVPHAFGPRVAAVSLRPRYGVAVDVATLTGSGAVPVLAALPAMAPPGDVSEIHGSRFPPGRTVTLTLSGMPGQVRARADAKGAFSVPLVILPHTPFGPHRLTATVAVVPAPLVVSASYLVVPGSLQPPDFVNRR